MKIKTRMTAVVLCMLSLILFMPLSASAAGKIDTDRDVHVTVSYIDGEKAIEGAVFNVYKAADMDEYRDLTVSENFADYPIDFDQPDEEGWQELALTMKGYAQRDGIAPVTSGQTNKDGFLEFSVKPGVYLIDISNVSTDDNYTYSAGPALLFVPVENMAENDWDYEVNLLPKFTKEYTPPDERTTLKALKIWDDTGYEKLRPEEVTVDLICDGVVFDTQKLSAGNEWRCSWNGLDPDHDWQVVERETDGYNVKTVREDITFTITNTYVVPASLEDLQVVKKINGDEPSAKSSFIFILKAENESCPMPEGSKGTSKSISITGSGSGEFGAIPFTEPGTYIYTISEKDGGLTGYKYDPNVYTIRYDVTKNGDELNIQRVIRESNERESDSIVFINKYSKSGNKLPQTGVLWWPVPVLLACGLVLCIIGILKKRTGRNEE